jgi:hypothetical protein
MSLRDCNNVITLSPLQRELYLTYLEELIGKVQRDQCDNNGAVIEHLQSARAYLFGAMPEEYVLALNLAKESLASMTDERLRTELTDDLNRLLNESL